MFFFSPLGLGILPGFWEIQGFLEDVGAAEEGSFHESCLSRCVCACVHVHVHVCACMLDTFLMSACMFSNFPVDLSMEKMLQMA